MLVFALNLRRVRRAGEHWAGSRFNSSLLSASQQGISFISNTACSMLLSLLSASHCSKCDTLHHLLAKTRSGVSSHRSLSNALPRCNPLATGLKGTYQTKAANTSRLTLGGAPK